MYVNKQYWQLLHVCNTETDATSKDAYNVADDIDCDINEK